MASESPTWRLPPSSFALPRGELINAYEAEEERITSVLCRKLEQLREEKLALENTLEPDSESHVNRLTRQISQLQAQLSQTSQPSSSSAAASRPNPEPPQPFMLLEAMRLENAQLRSRVSDLERDFLRVSRINEVYRQELIEHRRRLGLPYENLIGLAASASQSVSSSPADTFSPPPNRRIPTSSSTSYSHNHARSGPSIGAVPIPRVQSQTRIHPETLALTAPPSSDSTPPSSPSYSLSPTAPLFPGGPSSQMTTLTTPASNPNPPPPPPPQPISSSNGLARALTELVTVHAQRAGLTYPSVPPPSLASSLGSGSPVVPTLRVPPNSRRQSTVAETGSLRPGAGGFAGGVGGAGVGGRGEELEEIGEDDDSAFEEEYQPRAGLAIGLGRGRGRGGGGGGGIMGLGLSGTR